MKTFRACIITAVLLAVGCAGQQEFNMAQRLYQLRQYDSAMEQAQKALQNDPANPKYRQLLADIKVDAAREEYRRGLTLYERRQIDLALLAFEKARTLDPSFEEASQAYASVMRRKGTIESVISEIPALLSQGKPDEALESLAKVESFSNIFSEIADLKAQALSESTLLHTRQGNLYLQNGKFDLARKEFFVALNRTPNYRPAAEGMESALAEIKAADLVAKGRNLLDDGDFPAAYASFQAALSVVPGHKDAVQAMTDVSSAWARSLYDGASLLAQNGDFDSLAEALRRFERAGALTERFEDLDERISALKSALAPEFLRRAQNYEALGQDYLALALINYQMSLHCDGAQLEVSRRVSQVKSDFDRKRAFYIDIRSEDSSAGGSSFSRQVAQLLKETAISSGINDLYVLAPFDLNSPSSAASSGLAGRRLTIFTALLSEGVVTTGANKPEIRRSRYKVGTRYVPNPAYLAARKALAEAEAGETDVRQRYQDAQDILDAASTPEERQAAAAEVEVEKRRLFDEQDSVTAARLALASVPDQVEDEVFQPYDYKVFSVTMQATVEVSLSVADPDTGALRQTEVITGESSEESTYNDGVLATDANGVTPEAQNLPTESELIFQAKKSAAENAVLWLNKSLARLSRQYYVRARDLAEVGDVESAAEYYYAFYLSTPDKNSPEAAEAIDFVRKVTHLITDEERRPPSQYEVQTPSDASSI